MRSGFRLIILGALLLNGCVHRSEDQLSQDGINIDQIAEHYSATQWKVQFRIRNDSRQQKQALVRAWVDFEDPKLGELEPQTVGETLVTLQTNEQRTVSIPLAEQPGVSIDRSVRLFARRKPVVSIVGTRVYY